MTDKLLALLPFAGFYSSAHDAQIDEAFESIFEDDSGYVDGKRFSRARDALFRSMDWGKVHQSYASEYVATLDWCVQSYLGRKPDSAAPVLTFESMTSPREYNFETDRIFAHIEKADLRKMYDATPPALLAYVIESRFTSRDGFAPHYSGDVAAWDLPARFDAQEVNRSNRRGGAGELDHNEAGTILLAWLIWAHYGEHIYQPEPFTAAQVSEMESAAARCDEWLHLYLMEDARGSGSLDNMIWGALPPKGVKLANYVVELARPNNWAA